MRCSTWTANSALASPRTCPRPWHILHALPEFNVSEIFELQVEMSFYACTRKGHQSRSINAKSAGGSVVKSIEAESPTVSDHHINILPFHVFLVALGDAVSKQTTCHVFHTHMIHSMDPSPAVGAFEFRWYLDPVCMTPHVVPNCSLFQNIPVREMRESHSELCLVIRLYSL